MMVDGVILEQYADGVQERIIAGPALFVQSSSLFAD